VGPYSAQPILVAAPLFSERLATAMRSTGVSGRALAEQSGVDKGTITEWLQGGERAVRVETVRKVAATLGTTAEHLLDLPVDPDERPSAQSATAPLLSVMDRVYELLGELTALVGGARETGADS
jgi:transcriptional regulator with XRE-family HTH domain